jgi:hypothetical protein
VAALMQLIKVEKVRETAATIIDIAATLGLVKAKRKEAMAYNLLFGPLSYSIALYALIAVGIVAVVFAIKMLYD